MPIAFGEQECGVGTIEGGGAAFVGDLPDQTNAGGDGNRAEPMSDGEAFMEEAGYQFVRPHKKGDLRALSVTPRFPERHGKTCAHPRTTFRTAERGVLRQALMLVYLDDVARIVCSERLALKQERRAWMIVARAQQIFGEVCNDIRAVGRVKRMFCGWLPTEGGRR